MIAHKAATLVLCVLFLAASASLSFSQTNNDDNQATNAQAASEDAASNQPQESAQKISQNQAPPSDSQAPSLQDLGLTPSQTQGDPQLQARLDKRAHMLKIHQRL